MSTLTLSDLSMHSDEPHVSDRRLMTVLGFSDEKSIRRLMTRHADELRAHGDLRVTLTLKSRGERGAPVKTFWLNEAQALLVCLFARTPRAAAIRRQVIDVFMAWRRGQVAAPLALPAPPADPWSRMADRLAATRAQITLQSEETANAVALAVTHLPVWSNGRRPNFWPDLPVRELLTAAHRQMEIEQARALCARTFGPARTPSGSALHRYWQRLDRARGGRERG